MTSDKKSGLSEDVSTSAQACLEQVESSPVELQDNILTACCTAKGGRAKNEDQAGVISLQVGDVNATLAAVLDGMGGHLGGEIASAKACACLLTSFARTAGELAREADSFDAEIFLKDVLLATQAEVFTGLVYGEASREAGTTLSSVLVHEGTAYVANLGDSRVYLVRGGKTVQLTRDDSVVQELVDAGEISAEEAESHPYSNQITKAVCATQDLAEEQVSRHALETGDLLLLCSDGFWKVGQAAFEPIGAWLHGDREATASLKDLANELVAEAVRLDADDNVSVALVYCDKCGLKRDGRKTNPY